MLKKYKPEDAKARNTAIYNMFNYVLWSRKRQSETNYQTQPMDMEKSYDNKNGRIVKNHM